MDAPNATILNLKIVYNLYLLFFYHFSGKTCVYTMQFLVVYDRRQMTPEIVLDAIGGVREQIWSHHLIAHIGFLFVFPWHLSSIGQRLLVLGNLYSCKLRPEVVSAARWCHRQILMSPMDFAASVLYRWSVGNFRLYCTVQKWLNIIGCALNLALKQTFVNLIFEMIQSTSFSDCTSCVLRRCTFWAIKRYDLFLLCRDTRVNV